MEMRKWRPKIPPSSVNNVDSTPHRYDIKNVDWVAESYSCEYQSVGQS
jgi:hypothetical protein